MAKLKLVENGEGEFALIKSSFFGLIHQYWLAHAKKWVKAPLWNKDRSDLDLYKEHFEKLKNGWDPQKERKQLRVLMEDEIK